MKTLPPESWSYSKKWNSQIALDDYGTGYSSDSILLLINPDYVKIDMSIIHDIDADPNRQLLFENLSTYLKTEKHQNNCRRRGDLRRNENADILWHRLSAGDIISVCLKIYQSIRQYACRKYGI